MNQSERTFLSDGIRFSCARCSGCCCGRPGVVFLSAEELEALAKHEELTVEQFVKVYCRWIPSDDGFEYLSFRETSAYECIFWEEGIGCRVYELRPVQCRTYPFWSGVIKDEASWTEEGKKCPGIGKGELHSKDEVLEQETLYRERNLVRRK